jgi:hypothetical protein
VQQVRLVLQEQLVQRVQLPLFQVQPVQLVQLALLLQLQALLVQQVQLVQLELLEQLVSALQFMDLTKTTLLLLQHTLQATPGKAIL